MILKNAAACCAVMALAMVPAPKAKADLGEALAIGVLGAIIAGAASQGATNQGARGGQQTTRSTSAPQRPAISQAQLEQNRQVQTALNYFNYPVGAVDGVFGPATRNGIRDFEVAMGYSADGNLDDFERNFLLDSYRRAQTGAQMQPYSMIFAREGTQGLLRTYRNEQRGIPTPGVTAAAQPAPQSAPNAAPTLPSFGTAQGDTGPSVNSHCSQIQVLTTTNGGFTTMSTMSDPDFALNEQFCLTRTNAMAQASTTIASIAGLDDAQAVQQCAGLSEYMREDVQSLATMTPAAVQTDVGRLVRNSGQSEAQLRTTGIICLGVGYREDRADMALAAALVMVGIDEAAYGEVVAHHLREGFGTAASPERSGTWMERTLTSLENGANPAFLSNQSSERVALLRAAMAGGASAPMGAGLPTFPAPAGQ